MSARRSAVLAFRASQRVEAYRRAHRLWSRPKPDDAPDASPAHLLPETAPGDQRDTARDGANHHTRESIR